MKSFLRDLAGDLVEKRLWPVALALIVALVATPVLLTRGGDAAPASQAPARTAAPATGQALVKLDSSPPVSRYRGGRVRNPFAGSSPARSAPSTGSRRAASTATASPTPGSTPVAAAVPAIGATATTPAASSPSPSSGTSGGDGTQTTERRSTSTDRDAVVTHAVTLRFGRTDGVRRTLRDVARLTVLPSADQPVVGLLGVLRDGTTASFVLGQNTTARGNGTCKPSARDCKTVEMRGGDAEYLRVTGPDGRPAAWYYLKVLHIDRRESSKARAAAASARRSRAGARVVRRLAGAVRHLRYRPGPGVLVRARRAPAAHAASRPATAAAALLPARRQPGVAVWRSRTPAAKR